MTSIPIAAGQYTSRSCRGLQIAWCVSIDGHDRDLLGQCRRESSFATLKRELVRRRAWPTRPRATRDRPLDRRLVHPRRLHFSIDYLAPNEKSTHGTLNTTEPYEHLSTKPGQLNTLTQKLRKGARILNAVGMVRVA